MPAAHGTLIGFIELENGLSRDRSLDLDDTTIWDTLLRLGATDPSWDDWDTPPGGPQTITPSFDAPRFQAAAASNIPSSRFESTVPTDFPSACLEANLRQLWDDLAQATVALTERISRERHNEST